MKTLIAAAVLFVSPVVFAQAEATAPAKPEKAEGVPTEPPPPDVSKLPFTPESIKQVMASYQPKIQACYEELMATKEKVVQGRLMTSFTITKEGLVSKPKVLKKGTTLHDPKLNDCVVSVLASMQFPKPDRDQPIQYPLNLKAIK